MINKLEIKQIGTGHSFTAANPEPLETKILLGNPNDRILADKLNELIEVVNGLLRRKTPFKEIGVENPQDIYEGDKLEIIDHTHFRIAPENIVFFDDINGFWGLKGWREPLKEIIEKRDTFKVIIVKDL